jgi:hypothetical protein
VLANFLKKMESKEEKKEEVRLEDVTETAEEKKAREAAAEEELYFQSKQKPFADIKTDAGAERRALEFMGKIMKEYKQIQAVRVYEEPRVFNSATQPVEKKQRLDEKGGGASKPTVPKWRVETKNMFFAKFRRFAIFQHDKKQGKITFHGFFCPYDDFSDEQHDNLKRKASESTYVYINPASLRYNLPGERPVTNLVPFLSMDVQCYGNLYNLGDFEASDVSVNRRIKLLKGWTNDSDKAAVMTMGNRVGSYEDKSTFRTLLRAYCLGSTQDAGTEDERMERKMHADTWIRLETELMYKRLQMRCQNGYNLWEVFMKLSDMSTVHLIDSETGEYMIVALNAETGKAFTAPLPETTTKRFYPELIEKFAERDVHKRSKEWLYLDKPEADKFGWSNSVWKGGSSPFYEDVDEGRDVPTQTVFIPSEIVKHTLARNVFKTMLQTVVNEYNSQHQQDLVGIDGKSKLWTEVLCKLCREPACDNGNNCRLFH